MPEFGIKMFSHLLISNHIWYVGSYYNKSAWRVYSEDELVCLYKNTGEKRLSSGTAFKQLTSITFSSTHLVFNKFLFRSTMVFRERETEMPSWTSIIFTDTACSSSHSILFFFLPIQSKNYHFVLCVTPNWKFRVLWPRSSEGCWGDRKWRGPLCGRPLCHRRRLMFLEEREELALVTVLVSNACFRAATCTGLHRTRRLNIPLLIKPSCQGV